MNRREFLKASLASGAALAVGPNTLNRIIPPSPAPVTRPADFSPAFWKLATLPVMGWNSWDEFGINVTEEIFLATGQYMQKKLLPFGYRYACIDGGWYFQLEQPQKNPPQNKNQKTKWKRPPASMDAYGRYIPSPDKYPSAINGAGFKPIADKIHAMGLKFGIHTMRGIPREAYDKNTPIEGTKFFARDAADLLNLCTWSEDNYGVKTNTAGQAYYDSVIRMYASWGLDFLKNDDMSRPYRQDEIAMMRSALDRLAPNIVYSLSPGETPITSGSDVIYQANMWRITNDFWDNWENLNHTFDVLAYWKGFGGLGHWPDCDMLCLGQVRKGMDGARHVYFTKAEQRTHMTLWSIAPSPLILGCDLLEMDDWTFSLIANPEVIAINQDPAGRQGSRVVQDGFVELWAKDLYDGSKAVTVFNRGQRDADFTIQFSDLNLMGPQKTRNIWEYKDVGIFADSMSVSVRLHGVEFFKITPI
ncbi:MAG TPA: glycoside hydrolase family 27 protein [Phycisphaerae bacterium]|nr:glycoside hydrolase family 27 protein [Phycisphaerae bacterium]